MPSDPIRTVKMNAATYRLGVGMDGNGILKSGWGEPEAGFVWSEGRFASIALPPNRGRAQISLSLWGYVPAGQPAQDILIFANGLLKGTYEINEREVIQFSCDPSIGADQLELTLYIPSALSPKEAESSDDERRLGVALGVVGVREGG